MSVCPSVRLYVCLSVCLSMLPSHLFHNVPPILSSWNFQGQLPLTKVITMQKVEVRGHKSNFSPICVFPDHNPGMILPVWIHRWLWNDTHTLCEQVSYCFSRSFIKLQGRTGWKFDNLLWFEHLQMITVHERLWKDTQSSERHKCDALSFI